MLVAAEKKWLARSMRMVPSSSQGFKIFISVAISQNLNIKKEGRNGRKEQRKEGNLLYF